MRCVVPVWSGVAEQALVSLREPYVAGVERTGLEPVTSGLQSCYDPLSRALSC